MLTKCHIKEMTSWPNSKMVKRKGDKMAKWRNAKVTEWPSTKTWADFFVTQTTTQGTT